MSGSEVTGTQLAQDIAAAIHKATVDLAQPMRDCLPAGEIGRAILAGQIAEMVSFTRSMQIDIDVVLVALHDAFYHQKESKHV